MQIIHSPDYETMSRLAAETVIKEVRKSGNLLLCTATGVSPEGLYAELESTARKEPELFDSMRVIKLDEWYGLPPDDPGSCESYLQLRVIRPLRITTDNYISFQGNATNPVTECQRMETALAASGGIDVCILGLGKNGHLGFNEPGESLTAGIHLSRLAHSSRQHAMIGNSVLSPETGLTLGLSAILQSKKIIFLVSGAGKKEVVNQLFRKRISTLLPASFLWLHPCVECYIDDKSV